MALDDLTNSKKREQYEESRVTSDFDASNVEMDERFWQSIASYKPELLKWRVSSMSDSQVIFFISLLDNVIHDGISGERISESQKDRAQSVKQEMLDEWL